MKKYDDLSMQFMTRMVQLQTNYQNLMKFDISKLVRH